MYFSPWLLPRCAKISINLINISPRAEETWCLVKPWCWSFCIYVGAKIFIISININVFFPPSRGHMMSSETLMLIILYLSWCKNVYNLHNIILYSSEKISIILKNKNVFSPERREHDVQGNPVKRDFGHFVFKFEK